MYLSVPISSLFTQKFYKIQINWNKLEQAVSKVSWLWPYCCRKGAEQPDLQQCKLTVKEKSTVT